MTEQNIETTGFAPAPPVPPQVPVTPPPAPFPIPKTAPSSQNSVRARAPGWQFQQGKQVTPADARAIIESRVHDETKIYKPGTKRGTQLGFASNTVQGSASIVEQARALKNDPQLIYEFVYNNIEWEPGFSQQKGSLGCLLDGMGNSFDQSDLLVKLLRQAGFTANFVLGTIQLTEAELMAWFGTSDIWGSAAYCGNENIPYQSPVWNGSEWEMVMSHMWVEVVISGTTYVMDPSRKTYSRTTPVSGLDTIIGYTPATFLSNAQSGATVTADYVQNMNTANIHSDLTSMTSNLTTWIKANKPDATVDDILGGQSIVPVTLPITFATSLSYQTPGDVPTIWTGNIPLAYQTTLQVQFPDNSGGWCIDQTFTSDQLAGTRLTLTYNGSLQPVLKLDGVTIATGIAQGAGTWNSILLTVTHNGYPVNWYDQQWWQSFIYAGAHYLIGNAWGNLGRGQSSFHTTKLNANRAAGLVETSEPVMGEQLAVIWFNWAGQASRVGDLVNRIMNCHSMVNHQVGIMSFDSGGSGAFAGDIGGVSGSSTNLNNDVTKTPINDTVSAMHGVALEGAVLSQTTGLTPSATTTTVIDSANSAGSKIYKGTSTNWNTGANISAALVTAGYSSGDMNDIYNYYLQWGYTAMLADDPTVTLGAWTGWADWLYPSSGAFGLINGSYKGTGGQPGPAKQPPEEDPGKGKNKNQPTKNEPIGFFDGSYIYQHTDITIGSVVFPYELSFKRHYSSQAQFTNGTLGRGWSHNYMITASTGSDGFLAMGAELAEQGAGTLVELLVNCDLLADTARPIAKLVLASLSNSWWLDRIINNTALLALPDHLAVFVKQPDGTFTTPVNFVGTLSIIGGLYNFRTPQGIQQNFNASGQIETWIDPAGVTVTFGYSTGRLSTISNGLGRTLTLNYTGQRITSVSDGNGRTVQYGYDGSDNLISYANTLSQSTTYEYDQPGRLTKFYKPANPTTAFITNVYDTLSRVKAQSNARGQTWNYYFAGSRSEEVDPLANRSISYFNRYGVSIRDIDALGAVTEYRYDGLNRLVEKIFPESNQEQFTYDLNSNLLSRVQVAKSGSSLTNIVQQWTYDPVYNKVLTFVDALGNTWTFNYDSITGNLLSMLKPMVTGLTPQKTWTYSSRGQILTYTDETGMVTKFTYDGASEKLLTQVIDFASTGRLNLSFSYSYNAWGDATSITDPNSNQTQFVFNSERQPTLRIEPTPFGYQTIFGYDLNGNINLISRQTSSTPAFNTTSMSYSLTDKIQMAVDPVNKTYLWEYDGKDRLSKITDAESRIWLYSYNAIDLALTVTDPSLNVTDFRTYTINGKLYQITDGLSNVTTYSYDGFDRPDRVTYADGTFTQNLSYDSNGMVLTKLARSGSSVVKTFDSLGRVATKAPSGQPTVSYLYDLAGRLLSSSTPVVSGDPSSGLYQYYLDTAGRYVKESTPDGKDVTYQLDGVGNVVKLTYPDGYYVTRVFDQLNRLTDVMLNGAMSAALHFEYDYLSRRTKLIYGNGSEVNYTYANNNDMVSLVQVFTALNPLTISYSFNSVHQEIGKAASDPSYLWHPATAGAITYGTADNTNKYPSVGGVTLTYDGAGNLSSDGVWSYSYDTENHLLSAVSSGVSASYLYDGLHRQIQKTVGVVKTRFVYSALQRIADYDGSTNTLQSRYVYGPGLDEPLLTVAGSGTLTYLHEDRLGSIFATTNTAGSVTNKIALAPFGEGTVSGTSFGFTGQRYDSETDLYYYKTRYYSSKIGRFLQPDSNGYKDGLNLYQYVKNDPINQSDPLGLIAENSALSSLNSFVNALLALSGTSPAGSGSTDINTTGGVSGDLYDIDAQDTMLASASSSGQCAFLSGLYSMTHIACSALVCTYKCHDDPPPPPPEPGPSEVPPCGADKK